ncbi:MAG TPA: homoserine O-acetyltransferase [Candidatus Ozemobacteraceae bacterium]|nr:homoserine O-acetyltransferase [Candidatus Ozemobacteraceae bacterium]
MLVEKREFVVPHFSFKKAGRTIPVRMGYETCGTLNAAGDNAVLVCHFFTGTGHAAGRYAETDPLPGWWDELIGPGRTIATNKYFVICSDSFSNINAHNPRVITTGPATIDPETGKPYAMRFPIFTLDDLVQCQRMMIDHLGVKRLRLVIGPSMGGLQAFLWGKMFSDIVDKLVSVVATPMVRPATLMVPNQLGIEAIMLDPRWNGGDYHDGEPPRNGLLLAFKILVTSTRTDHWADANFGRRLATEGRGAGKDPYNSFAGRFLVEEEIEKTVLMRMQYFDANSYIFIAKANALFDLCEPGQTLSQALGRLKMPVKMIIDESDLLFTREQAELAAPLLPDCETFYYNSRNGHLSCLFDIRLFAAEIEKFFKA